MISWRSSRTILFATLLFTALSFLIACGDDTPVGNPVLVAYPGGCAPVTPGDLSTIALSHHGALETFVPPGLAVDQMALDYAVFPLAAVDTVTVMPTWEALGERPAVTVSSPCPPSLDLSELWAGAEGDGLVSAFIEASHEMGPDVLTGRVFRAIGDQSVTVERLGAAGDGESWLLFEAAAGPARIIVIPVPDDSSLLLENMPRINGLFASIKTDELALDEDTGVVYGPVGFADSWRLRVLSFSAALMENWSEEEDNIAVLRSILTTSLVQAAVVPLSEVDRLTLEQPLMYLTGGRDSQDGLLEVGCEIEGVEIVSTGLEEVTIDRNRTETTLEPLQSTVVEGVCAAGEEAWTMSLRVTSFNDRNAVVIARSTNSEGSP